MRPISAALEPELYARANGQRVRCHIYDPAGNAARPDLRRPEAGRATETAEAGVLAVAG